MVNRSSTRKASSSAGCRRAQRNDRQSQKERQPQRRAREAPERLLPGLVADEKRQRQAERRQRRRAVDRRQFAVWTR